MSASDPTARVSATRRRFTQALVAAAGAPLLAPAALLAQAAPAPGPAPTPSPTPVPTPEAPSSAAEALTEVVRIRWGKHLSGEELGEIAKSIDSRLRGAQRMKAVKLENGDEPDFVFSAAVK
jgi:hypothetical protein